MMKKTYIIMFFLFITTYSRAYGLHAPPDTPRILPIEIKSLIEKGINYIFIDSASFGDYHICGAIYIGHEWLPPYGKNRVREINIPKNYYIFCY